MSDTNQELDSKVKSQDTDTTIEETDDDKVNSESTEDKKTGKGKNNEEENRDDTTSSEEKPLFRFNNREFSDANEVIKEANRILGRNVQLSGDYEDTQEKLEKLEEELNNAIEANKKWQEYYSKGEQPDLTDEKLEKALEKIEARKAENERVKSITQDFEKLKEEEDFTEVYPEMRNILKEKGKDVVNKMTPMELYNLAKIRLGLPINHINSQKIKEEADRKAVHQTKAKSQVGGGGKSGGTDKPQYSPEVADLLNHVM